MHRADITIKLSMYNSMLRNGSKQCCCGRKVEGEVRDRTGENTWLNGQVNETWPRGGTVRDRGHTSTQAHPVRRQCMHEFVHYVWCCCMSCVVVYGVLWCAAWGRVRVNGCERLPAGPESDKWGVSPDLHSNRMDGVVVEVVGEDANERGGKH